MKQHTNYLSLSFLLSLAIIFPGCKWFECTDGSCSREATAEASASRSYGIEYPDASDTSDVIATIDGKPLVTVAMLEKQYQETLKDPQAAAILQYNPDFEYEIKKQLIQALVTPAIITAHVYGNGLNESAEYKNRLSELVKNATQMANIEVFQKGLNVSLSDADVKAFYEQHKNEIPGLIISRPGVKTEGVSFKNETDAKTFAEKAKGKSSEFQKLAEEANLGNEFKDFETVNATTTNIDPVLRSKVAQITSFPTIEVVKASNGLFWVINAISKEEAKYAQLETVREQLTPYIKQQKEQEAALKAIEDYKKELKIEVKETYFQDQMSKKSADAIEQLKEAIMMEQQAAAQEANTTPSRVV